MIKDTLEVAISDAIVVGDEVWFCAFDFNGLYSMDIISGAITSWGRFPDEPVRGGGFPLYYTIIHKYNKLYFIPYAAKKVAVFDLDMKCFSSIEIEEKYLADPLLCAGACMYEDCIYAFGAISPTIFRINILNNEVDYLCEWSNEIKSKAIMEETYFFRHFVRKEHIIFTPICNSGYMLEFDCENKNCVFHRIGNGDVCYLGIVEEEDDYLCFPINAENNIVKVNNKFEVIENYELEIKDTGTFAGIWNTGTELKVFPWTWKNSTFNDNHFINNGNMKFMQGDYTLLRINEKETIYFEKENCILTIYRKESNKTITYKIEINYKETSLEEEFRERPVCESQIRPLERLLESLK